MPLLSGKMLKEAKTKALQKIVFDGFRSPLVWMSHAQELYASAKVLWKKSSRLRRVESNPLARRLSRLLSVRLDRYQRPGFLLIGLAIENVAKGIVIGLADESEQESALQDLSKNHDIRTVLSKIPQNLRPKYDGKVVEALENHIVWASKYPVPKKGDDYSSELEPKDFEEIEKLYVALIWLGLEMCKDDIGQLP